MFMISGYQEGEYYYVFSTDAQFGMTTYKGLHIRKSKDVLSTGNLSERP